MGGWVNKRTARDICFVYPSTHPPTHPPTYSLTSSSSSSSSSSSCLGVGEKEGGAARGSRDVLGCFVHLESGWVGGWVVEFLFLLCMGARKVEEEEAVRMTYGGLGMGGWVGGWVGGKRRNGGRQPRCAALLY